MQKCLLLQPGEESERSDDECCEHVVEIGTANVFNLQSTCARKFKNGRGLQHLIEYLKSKLKDPMKFSLRNSLKFLSQSFDQNHLDKDDAFDF